MGPLGQLLAARRLIVTLGLVMVVGSASGQTYRVRAGDTLSSIARTHGITVARLSAVNGLSSTRIFPGQVLNLGGSAGSAAITARPGGSVQVYQRGLAVYYPGRRDSRTVYTAAHLTLPKGTWVKVTHQRTGRSVNVLINDRGPFDDPRRIIDLSDDAARVLGILREGIAPVTISIVSR